MNKQKAMSLKHSKEVSG